MKEVLEFFAKTVHLKYATCESYLILAQKLQISIELSPTTEFISQLSLLILQKRFVLNSTSLVLFALLKLF